MSKVKVANLVGKRFGSWQVDRFEATIVTSQRGGAGGKGKGPARRALWLCHCIMCGVERHLNTSFLTKQPGPVHGTCKKSFEKWQREGIELEIALQSHE